MASPVTLLLIPLIWLAVATVIVAVCRVAASGQRAADPVAYRPRTPAGRRL